MSSWQEQLYPRLPISLQNLACTAHGRTQRNLRYGGEFHSLLEWLEESQWWPVEEIEQYQKDQLRRLITHAYETVPYYRRVFDERKLKPGDFVSLDDLQKLPVLTKELVKEHSRELLSTKFPLKSLVFCHTSGTTGKSLQFYHEPRAIQFRWAVWWRHRKRFGVEFNQPYATFTGLPAVPLEQTEPPFWRTNRSMRQTIFPMHHIVTAKVGAIAERLNEGGFDYYSGYPSILYVLAGLLEENGYRVQAPPKMIFTGAENLFEDQRHLMSRVFQSEVTDEYGFAEGCGNASRCEADVYHEDFEFGILECDKAQSIGTGHQQGRIVATGFSSYAMPLIRYEVGDVGTWRKSGCACGRVSKLLTQIDGRAEDYVVTPEGRKILRFDYIFKDTTNVRNAQIVQKELGSISLNIVRRPTYSQSDEELLKKEIRNRISSTLSVNFQYVDEIERESNGKIRAVKSLIKN